MKTATKRPAKSRRYTPPREETTFEHLLLEAGSSPSSLIPSTLTDLVVIRQSAKRALRNESEGEELDLSQFQKMATNTCNMPSVRDLPGVDVIRANAAVLVRQDAAGAKLRETLGAIPLTAPGARIAAGYLIVIEHVGYVLIVYSAAKASVTRGADHRIHLENTFTSMISRLVTRFKVRRVHVAKFSRLVRHTAVMGELYNALTMAGHATTVYSEFGVMQMNKDTGQHMFKEMAKFSEWDYKTSVGRLTGGWHEAALEGLWPKSESQLPAIGYKLRSEADPVPVPDPDKQELVSNVVSWYADGLTLTQIAAKLAEAGYVHAVAAGRQGAGSIADLAHPATAVRNLLISGLPLWLTGRYMFHAQIPQWLSNDHLLNQLKDRVQLDDEGEELKLERVSFTLDFHHEELPGGEWTDRKTIEKAIKRLARTSPGAHRDLSAGFSAADDALRARLLDKVQPQAVNVGGRPGTSGQVKPLAGIGEWVDGDTQYRVSARHKTNYLLLARPADQAFDSAQRPRGWADDAERIAYISPADLHVALATSIANGLELGTEWSRAAAELPVMPEATDAEIANLAAAVELAQEQLEATEARMQSAIRTGSEKTLDRLTLQAEKIEAEIIELTMRLAQAQATISNARGLSPLAVADLGELRDVLAALAQTEDRAPLAINEALRRLLVDLRIRPVDRDLFLEISAKVQVMTTDGPVVLGPITSKIRSNRWHYQRSNRADVLAEAFLRDGKTLDEAAELAGYKDTIEPTRHLHRFLRTGDLVPSKGRRAAIIYCPIVELRRVIWAEYEARQASAAFQVPAGIDPAYAAHVRSTYTSADEWAMSWCSDSHRLSRAAIAAAQAADQKAGLAWDKLSSEILPAAGFNMTKGAILELVSGKGSDQAGSATRTVSVFDPALERSTPWHRHADRRVWARSCPYCGTRTLTHVLRVPEVPGGMLCTSCRHVPSLPTVTFPVEYLRTWAGPRGTGAGKAGSRQGTIEDLG